jgi:hypothetical protein
MVPGSIFSDVFYDDMLALPLRSPRLFVGSDPVEGVDSFISRELVPIW